MKLYATTTSERASKGQGGNKYLEIDVYDENQDRITSIKCYPEVKIQEYDYMIVYSLPSGKTIRHLYSKAKKKKAEVMPNRATDGEWDEHN